MVFESEMQNTQRQHEGEPGPDDDITVGNIAPLWVLLPFKANASPFLPAIASFIYHK